MRADRANLLTVRGYARGVLVILAALFCAAPSHAASDDEIVNIGEPPLLTIPEIFMLMEQSDTKYVINPRSVLTDVPHDGFADLLWPPQGKRLVHPWVVVDDAGRRTLEEYPTAPAADALLEQAARHFEQRRYQKALEINQGIVEKFPRCYQALSNAGRSLYAMGQYDRALEYFFRAIDINHYDPLLYMYEGDTLMTLDRPKQATTAYIKGLALKPKHQGLMERLGALSGELGLTLNEKEFIPQSLARAEGDGVAIYVDENEESGFHWLAFANCKAIWLGEAQHRESMTRSRNHQWTTVEEQECLASLLDGYALKEKGASNDPALERLNRIAQGGFLDAFIMYEIGSRVHPNIMLLLSDAMRENMAAFITRYIVVPTAK